MSLLATIKHQDKVFDSWKGMEVESAEKSDFIMFATSHETIWTCTYTNHHIFLFAQNSIRQNLEQLNP